MSEILVKKVKPCDLSTHLIFMLNHLYKTELGKFTVMYDTKASVLYVNEKVPEKDIKNFLTIAEYEGKYINDPDCEIADTIEQVYKKYGYSVWSILTDIHKDRKKKEENERARQEAREIYKIIYGYEIDDTWHDVFCDKERLVYHLGVLANKDGRRTAENIVNYSTKYAFLFGYLLGNGTISDKEGTTK